MHPLLARARRWIPLPAALRRPSPRVRFGAWDPFGLLPVSIRLDQFNSHLYVVGQSGQGKSKFLQHLLTQLVQSDWGCGLFDPHSDLAGDFIAQLACYPRRRPWLAHPSNQARLIYVDPARGDTVIPCNILRNPAATPYEIAENVVESFRRVWPETLAEAPRFAQIMRNAVLVLAVCGLSLLELEPLLTDRAFRLRLLEQVEDGQVVAFFRHQFDRWGREQPLFISPVLNKVSAFLFKPQVRAMLGADENRLDFRAILDRGQVLVLNLGCFRDEETQRLLGSLFLTSLEQAAFSRSDSPPAQRRPFFCMVDEFPLFCARDQTGLARILSECRKYRLHLGLAHQTIAQLPGQRIQGALENAKLKVVFGTGRQTAEAIVKELFLPNPRAIKHEVPDEQAKERTHPVFDPLAEQFEVFTQSIQRLARRRVLVKLPDSRGVIPVRVPAVPPTRLDGAQLDALKAALARRIGRPAHEVQAQIRHREQRFGVPGAAAAAQRANPSDAQDTPSAFWQ